MESLSSNNVLVSCDDGSLYDLRVADLLKKYKIKGIFYIPVVSELSEDSIRYLAEDFEIGSHTVNHAILRDLHPDIVKWELEHSKRYLEAITERPVGSFCYPRGRYNKEVIEAVKQAGYLEARTTKVLNNKLPIDPYEIITTIHVHPSRTEYEGKHWLQLAKRLFLDAKNNEDGYYHAWCHGYEIERYNLWEEFEELLKFINYEMRILQ